LPPRSRAPIPCGAKIIGNDNRRRFRRDFQHNFDRVARREPCRLAVLGAEADHEIAAHLADGRDITIEADRHFEPRPLARGKRGQDIRRHDDAGDVFLSATGDRRLETHRTHAFAPLPRGGRRCSRATRFRPRSRDLLEGGMNSCPQAMFVNNL
jgi:hypothetical protein